ncbi:MAG: bifunctional riboflavin kinase/FAD synthetase [Acidobacteria bacterium]|nr:bifunctional riboflavin kinase/FAD synthetase [Acidobacteriota bacterium]
MPDRFRVYSSLEETGGRFGPCALTVGNFDGVHLAHQRLLGRVVKIGRARGWTPSVLTFHPHPARVVAPERAPRLLSEPAERAEWMRRGGIEQVLILPFDAAFSQLEAEEFIARILAGTLGARVIVVGENFRFGRGHQGDARLLAALGGRYGYSAEIVPGLGIRGRMVSSSEVRRLIDAGQVALAARLLGRPYALAGRVMPGRGVGSRKTVPTLNLATEAEILPAQGVYVTRTRDLVDGRTWPSVTNVGARPTFGPGELSIETFLLEPLDGADPRRMAVEFLRRLREERRFESPEALRAQILRDVARAQAWHRRARRWLHAG